MAEYKVKDISLAENGRKKIEWAESRMPVIMQLRREMRDMRPLQGARIAGCLHVTKETAVLVETLAELGADVAWSGCNPLSTQDDIAAALARSEIKIFAWHGMSVEEFYWAIEKTVEILDPTLTLDDGADLIFTMHNKYRDRAMKIKGGTEETTTGVKRLRAMAKEKALLYPVIAVNDAETKWDFDNVYGTGQSSIDGILRATNILLAAKNFVVAGYGHCGRGCAMKAKGMGARVIVTEVRPTAALKAALDGMEVMPMDEAARVGDIFITATGIKDVITGRHFDVMKDGAVVCNTGHYDCEIRIPDLKARAESVREIRPNNEEHRLKDGRRIYLLAKGRLVNLAAAEGHPSEVMDMSFCNQLLALKMLHEEKERRVPAVYELPVEQDQEIGRLKLGTMGMSIDVPTPEQVKYAGDWKAGT
jgi:adenosylhomocysteinase